MRSSAWWIAQSRSCVVKCRAGVNLTNRQLTLDATRWCCRSFSKTWLAMGKHAPRPKMPARHLSCNMMSERDSWLLGVAGLLFCCTSWKSVFRLRRVSAITLKSLPMCSLTLAPSDTHRMASCTCWTAISELNQNLSASRTARTDLTLSSPVKRESTTKCWRVRPHEGAVQCCHFTFPHHRVVWAFTFFVFIFP